MADAVIPFTQVPVVPAGLGAAFAMIVIAIIRNWGGWRKLTIDANQALVVTLTRRVDTLERKQEQKDAKHDAEVSLLRHQNGGLEQCLDLLLDLLEQVQDLPERAKQAVAATKRKRKELRDRQATESATMRGVAYAVQSFAPPDTVDD